MWAQAPPPSPAAPGPPLPPPRQVFEGNVDGRGEVSNAFIPPIVTRYLRVTPLSWHQRVAMKVALLGCQLARARAPRPYGERPTARPPPWCARGRR